MARGPLRKTRAARQVERDAGETSRFGLDIEIDEHLGSLRIYDPRAFQADRRAFCRCFMEAVSARPGFRKAEIDLDGASCHLEFDPRSSSARTMADSVSAAVQDAANDRSVGRPKWWRPAPRWSTLTAYRSAEGLSLWETLDAQPGRISLRHPALSGDRSRLAQLADSLQTLDGIEACRFSAWSRTLTLDFRPDRPIADRLLDALERALQEGMAAKSARPALATIARPDAGGPIELATRYHRLKSLALAGGSFAMTLVGLVIPGVPTVPFLLATSYYLARSSPRLNDRLRRTPIFGPILDEWERHHGLSGASKARLMGLTAAIVFVTVAVTPLAPVILVVVLILASVSIYGIARLPAISSQTPDAVGVVRASRFALPAP